MNPRFACTSRVAATGTSYWVFHGTGGWCGAVVASVASIGLCRPHDGVVSVHRGRLAALDAGRMWNDGNLSDERKGTHFGGSEGPCNIEVLKSGVFADGVSALCKGFGLPSTVAPAVLASGTATARVVGILSDRDSIAQELYARGGTIVGGGVVSDTVIVDTTTTEVAFVQSWSDGGLSLELRTLSGIILTPADTSGGDLTYGIDFQLGYQALTVRQPEAGNWIVETKASAAGASQGYLIEAFAYSRTGLLVSVMPSQATSGSMVVRAALLTGTGRLRNANIVAAVTAPDSLIRVLQLFDDGAHADSVSGDGVYGVELEGSTGLGLHRIEVTAAVVEQGVEGLRRVAVTGFSIDQVADLSLTPPDVTVRAAPGSVQGDSLLVEITVHNLGSAPAIDGRVLLQEVGASTFVAATLDVAAGGQGAVTMGWHPSRMDSISLVVYVDPLTPFLQARYDNDSVTVVVRPTTVSVPRESARYALELAQSYPNPTAGTATIPFTLAHTAEIDLAVYDLAGRRVATLMKGRVDAGRHAVAWSGRTVWGARAPTGIYFYQIRTDGRRIARRMLLLK